MKTLKHIQEFIRALFSSFMSLFKTLISSRPVSKLPSKLNDSCVILGNGPSLETSIQAAKQTLSKSDLICVNFFPLTHLFEELKPRFFVACDSVFWDKRVSQDLVQRSEQMFDRINEKVDWEFYLFMPRTAKNKGDWQKRIAANKNITIVYYNLTPIEGIPAISYLLFKLKMGIPRPHNVLIPSLFHGINLTYSNIYLLGAEHSWLNEITVDQNNNVFVGHRHFYKEQQTNPQIKKNYQENMLLHEVLHTFMTAFKGYHDLQAYSETKEVKIYNSTPGSFIDAFERKELID